MGQLSTATIISEALLQASNSSLTTRALVWLNAWLRSQYRAWPWPFLQRRVTGVALAASATSLSIGAGAGGVTPEIQRIHDPLWLYNTDYSVAARPRIRTLLGGSVDDDETIHDPAKNTGKPEMFKVRADASTWGKWTLVPIPVPDKAYLLALDYLEQPADISVTTNKPIYPNDRTLIQAVYADALKHMDDPRYGEALSILASMTVDDRVKYGEVAGTNDMLGLDPSVYR